MSPLVPKRPLSPGEIYNLNNLPKQTHARKYQPIELRKLTEKRKKAEKGQKEASNESS